MPRLTPRPIDRHPPAGMYPMIDVDHDGVTATGESFDHRATDRAIYAGQAREEWVILRHPCGRLEMAIRIHIG